MTKRVIEHPEFGIIILQKNAKSRSVKMRFNREGILSVSLPRWYSFGLAYSFVLSQTTWIKNHRPANSPLSQIKHIGLARMLIIGEDSSVNKIKTKISDDSVRITYSSKHFKSVPELEKKLKSALERVLKRDCQKYITQRLNYLSEYTNIDFHNLNFIKLTSRWGSCDTYKNLKFSIYVIQLPKKLIDYVILHELAHTRAMSHGPEFKSIMDNICPDFRNLRKELKKFRPSIFDSQNL